MFERWSSGNLAQTHSAAELIFDTNKHGKERLKRQSLPPFVSGRSSSKTQRTRLLKRLFALEMYYLLTTVPPHALPRQLMYVLPRRSCANIGATLPPLPPGEIAGRLTHIVLVADRHAPNRSAPLTRTRRCCKRVWSNHKGKTGD